MSKSDLIARIAIATLRVTVHIRVTKQRLCKILHGSSWAGLGGKEVGPGSPKEPEELSLMFIKSHDITHIFQKCCEPQDLRHHPASILLRNFQPHIFNYRFSSKSRSLTLILHRSSLSGNIRIGGLADHQGDHPINALSAVVTMASCPWDSGFSCPFPSKKSRACSFFIAWHQDSGCLPSGEPTWSLFLVFTVDLLLR